MCSYRSQSGFALTGALVSFAALVLVSAVSLVTANKYLKQSTENRSKAAGQCDIYCHCTNDCTVNSYQCAGSTLQKCLSQLDPANQCTHPIWVTQQTCAAGTTCNAATGACSSTCSGQCISAMAFANGNYTTATGSCATGFVCAQTGQALLPSGASCTASSQCVIGLMCIAGKCASASTLISAAGGPCGHDNYTCQAGLTCTNQTCRAPQTCTGTCVSSMTFANGNYTTASGTCATGLVCAQAAPTLRPNGSACTGTGQCASGICYQSQCRPSTYFISGTGGPCGHDNFTCQAGLTCTSGTCRTPVPTSTPTSLPTQTPATCTGTCVSSMAFANGNYTTATGSCATGFVCAQTGQALLPSGASCTASSQCVIGLMCIAGKCASASTLVSGQGGPCGHDNYTCQAGLTCTNQTCRAPQTCTGTCVSSMTFANGNYTTDGVSGTCNTGLVCAKAGQALLPSGSSCTASSQCVIGLMCIQGKCASASLLVSDLNGPCGHDNFSCKPNLTCQGGTCRPTSIVHHQGEACGTTSLSNVTCDTGLVCLYGSCQPKDMLTTPVTSLADLTPEHYAATCDPAKPECQKARQFQLDSAVLQVDKDGLQACYQDPNSQACRSYNNAKAAVGIGGIAAIIAAPIIAPVIGSVVSTASLGGTAGTLGTIANLPTAAASVAQVGLASAPSWLLPTAEVVGMAANTYSAVTTQQQCSQGNQAACQAFQDLAVMNMAGYTVAAWNAVPERYYAQNARTYDPLAPRGSTTYDPLAPRGSTTYDPLAPRGSTTYDPLAPNNAASSVVSDANKMITGEGYTYNYNNLPQYGKRVGEGSFGVTYVDPKTNTLTKVFKPTYGERVLLEGNASQLHLYETYGNQAPNITFRGRIPEGGFQQEFYPNSVTLDDYLSNGGTFTQAEANAAVSELAQTQAVIGQVHGDLVRPNNPLIADNFQKGRFAETGYIHPYNTLVQTLPDGTHKIIPIDWGGYNELFSAGVTDPLAMQLELATYQQGLQQFIK